MASTLKDLILTFQYEEVRALYNNLIVKDSFLYVDHDGNNFLHLIAKAYSAPTTTKRISEEKQAALVRFLIDTAGISPDKKNVLGQTPYDIILKHSGKHNLVAYSLLPRSYSPNITEGKAEISAITTPAVPKSSSPTVVPATSSEPLPENTTPTVNAQLFALCKTGQVMELKKILDSLDATTNLSDIRGKEGETLLITAVQAGQKGVAIFLMTYSRMKIDVLARDIKGRRASDYAEDSSLEALLRSAELAKSS